jgi:hypothetical protein
MADTFAQYVVLGFLAMLASVVGLRILSGTINVNGLLHDKETGAFSPGRLQLLIFTLGGAFYYLSKILSAPELAGLPPVPEVLLLVTGASNGGYLGGKIYSRFFSQHARGIRK